MKNFAFIFARGGSKGLAGKNILPISGKTLVELAVEIAFDSSLIEEVFVSTESAEIANIGKASGATIIDRPAYLSEDDSNEWKAWQHAVEWVKRRRGDFDYFVSLPPTSPLRAVEDVEAAILEIFKKKAEICISVTPTNHSPYFNMVNIGDDGSVNLVIEPKRRIFRRQDSPKIFNITTVVYVAKPDFILRCNNIFAGKVTSVIVPKNRSVDIDDIYDFKLAEIIMKEQL